MTERRWLPRNDLTTGEQGRLAALRSYELTGATASRGTITRADALLGCAMGKTGLRFRFNDLAEDLRKMLGEFAAKVGNVVDASQFERVQGRF